MASTLVTPYLISEPFGTSAANPTYINLPIPLASQIGTTVNAASFTDGFPPSTMTPEASGGLPFFGQDLNGILWMITAYCANFAAGAIPGFNSTLASAITGYPVGAMVKNAAGTGFWLNQTNGNTNNPDGVTAPSGWVPIAWVNGASVTLSSGSTALNTAQYGNPVVLLEGTLTGNAQIIFPAGFFGEWIVVNETTGAYVVSAAVNGGSNQVTIPQTGRTAPTTVYSDSAQLWNTGVSTAGLAPIASPALTGTPTAPTAASSSNTTQIATTAMVQSAITAALTAYATKASPIFTGTPTAPTAGAGTNTTQLATTAFVTAAIATAGANQLVRVGVFTCANAGTSVSFSPAFPTACASIALTQANTSGGSSIGFAGYNSKSKTGLSPTHQLTE